MTEENQVVKRLDRFESKLDKLADAVLTIARVEERQSQHARTMERIWSSMESMNTRLSTVETLQSKESVKIGFGERVWWIAASAGIGMIAFYLRSKGV